MSASRPAVRVRRRLKVALVRCRQPRRNPVVLFLEHDPLTVHPSARIYLADLEYARILQNPYREDERTKRNILGQPVVTTPPTEVERPVSSMVAPIASIPMRVSAKHVSVVIIRQNENSFMVEVKFLQGTVICYFGPEDHHSRFLGRLT